MKSKERTKKQKKIKNKQNTNIKITKKNNIKNNNNRHEKMLTKQRVGCEQLTVPLKIFSACLQNGPS